MLQGLIQLLNTLSEQLVSASWEHFIQLSVLFVLLLFLDQSVGRRLGSRWRSALWLLFFVKLLLPPNLALPTSPAYYLGNGSAKSAATTFESATEIQTSPDGIDWSARIETPDTDAAAPEASHPIPAASLSWQSVLLLCWLAGVSVLALGAIHQRRQFRVRLAQSLPGPGWLNDRLKKARLELGVRQPVSIRLFKEHVAPMVAGLRRPTIYLPCSLVEQLDESQLYSVIAHELYHVKRGDLIVTRIQSLARILFFHYPIMWWVNSRLSRLREEAVDQAVLSHREIGRQTYSHALVNAAAFTAGLKPPFRFALGVIETKSQLENRIKMNLSKPRSGHVRLGVPGIVSIITLGFVLVPMAPRLTGSDNASLPSPSFAPIDEAALVERIHNTTTDILNAFNQRRRDEYISSFSDDPIILPNGSPLLVGLSDVAEMYLQSPATLVYEPMEGTRRQLLDLGDWIVESQLVKFNFRLSPQAPVMTDPRQAITIWEKTGNGALKVKLLAWNRLANLETFDQRVEPVAFKSTLPAGEFTREGDFSAVLAAEEAFHDAVLDKRLTEASNYYADGAIMIPVWTTPVQGRKRILDYLRALTPDQYVTGLEREVAYVEGNDNYVLVVDLYRWNFRIGDSNTPVSVTGKAAHLWERGKDGAWRLLLDLPNPSQPSVGGS